MNRRLPASTPAQAYRRLLREVEGLRFGPSAPWVYNPLSYARRPFARYLALYGAAPKEALLVGMNPGPWGMAQTGIPFGEVAAVRDWMGIDEPVGRPPREHPKRPVLGFSCPRSEVSGRRLWGWARDRFKTPRRFFARFFVANYCPLAFFDARGRNLTPDHLPAPRRRALEQACDRALRETVRILRPKVVVGVGGYSAKRCRDVLAGAQVRVGEILHPSPASPLANRGWQRLAEAQLRELGLGKV